MVERRTVRSTTPAGLVGREHELELVRRQLADPDGSASALVIQGEAGIGKTSLWRAGCEHAGSLGLTMLTAQPTEVEIDLPLVVLNDLLGALTTGPMLGHGLRELLAPPIDRLRLGMALVRLLTDLTSSGSAVVAIDDVQWLDPASAEILAFALRRLDDRPIRLLLTQRSSGEAAMPLGLERAMRRDRLSLVPLAGLDASQIGGLLRAHLDVSLPRPRLVELQRISEGNPLFAIEIASAALRAGGSRMAAPFVVPRRFADVFGPQVARLTEAGRRAVLLVAAGGVVAADVVVVAAGGIDGVREAIGTGCLELDGERIRVRHPLIGSTVYEDALPAERREAHQRLAAAVSDAVERARHLALASTEHDVAVADELDAAATLAAARGSPALGAFLAGHAAQRTPPGMARAVQRRRILAAELLVSAGDPAGARVSLERLAVELLAGRDRARVLLLLADTVGDDLGPSIRLAEQALDEADGEPSIGAEANTALGVYTWIAGDLARAAEHIGASVELAKASGDDRLVAIAIGELCYAEAVLGRPWPVVEMDHALAIERRIQAFPPWQRPSFQLGVILTYTDRPDEARPLILAELERVRAAGDEPARVGVLFRVAELELRAGNWAAAVRASDEAVELAQQAAIEQELGAGVVMRALVQAHLGDLDGARHEALRALELADAMGDRIVAIRARGVLGLVEVSAGKPTAAIESLEPAMAEQRAMGVGELSIAGVPEQLIEALVAVGRVDDAEVVAVELADRGRLAGRSWHAAVAARGRALVAAARGEHDRAVAALDDAYAAHERLPNPFTLARTHLAAGVVARRARKWAAARNAFKEALDVFDGLGAARWAERAATELGRLPGRPPAGRGLTRSEHAVAQLAAMGLPNKQIAARLSVTTRTVEQHISSIDEKLGVDSRAALARTIDRDDALGPPADPAR